VVATPTETISLQLGQRVRIKTWPHSNYNWVGIIVEKAPTLVYNAFKYRVQFDDGSLDWFYEGEFELY
jgi:hypothetical protein